MSVLRGSTVAPKFLNMATVHDRQFYFPCFYGAAHKFNILFYSVEVKKSWRFLSYKASFSQNFLRYIDTRDDRPFHFLEIKAICKHKHETLMTKFHSEEVFDILLCVNGLGNIRGRGRATKTKKETVFQPNGNSCKIFLVHFLTKNRLMCVQW